MSNLNELFTSNLLHELKVGKASAFEEVYKLMGKKIYHFVNMSIRNKEDAEEIVQEVFVKLWNERSNINVDKSLQAFLYIIAKNKINDHLRKVLNEKKYIESVIQENVFSDTDLEKNIDYRDTERVIMHLISLLPEKRRRVFELSRLKGLTYREISVEMEISENTVDTQMRKALSFVREGFLRLSIYFLLLCGVNL